MFIQQGGGCQDKSRSAVSTLECPFINKCLLDSVQGLILLQTFNSQDFLASSLFRKDQASTHGFAVDQNSAGAAHTDAAALLCSDQSQVVTQDLKQGARPFPDLIPVSVYVQDHD